MFGVFGVFGVLGMCLVGWLFVVYAFGMCAVHVW